MLKSQLKRSGNQCISVSMQDLSDLKESAKLFSLTKLKINASNMGQRSSRLLARGMEFAETRRYLPGDDVRNIDWRVTARTGKAHTKLFAEEKESKVIVALDMRAPMFFATQGVYKSVQASLITALLSWNALHKGKLLGGLVFDDATTLEFKPASLKRGVFPFFKGIVDKFEKRESVVESVVANDKTFEKMLLNLQKLATQGSLVFIISDFRKFSPLAKDLLVQLSRKADVRLVFLYDKIERELPKNGYYSVTDGHFFASLNTSHSLSLEKYKANFIERKNTISCLESYERIHFMECSTEDDCLTILQKHFN